MAHDRIPADAPSAPPDPLQPGPPAAALAPLWTLARLPATVIDVGAGRGAAALAIGTRHPHWAIIAFEHDPSLHADIDRVSAQLRRRGTPFRLETRALGAAPGRAPLWRAIGPDGPVPATASLQPQHFDLPAIRARLDAEPGAGRWHLEAIEVPVTSLDLWLDGHATAIQGLAIVHLNVPGAEAALLRGMARMLARLRPVVVLAAGPTGQALDLLAAAGYRLPGSSSSLAVHPESAAARLLTAHL